MPPTRVSHKSVSYKSVKNCLCVCFRVRVCIPVRGFLLVFVTFSALFLHLSTGPRRERERERERVWCIRSFTRFACLMPFFAPSLYLLASYVPSFHPCDRRWRLLLPCIHDPRCLRSFTLFLLFLAPLHRTTERERERESFVYVPLRFFKFFFFERIDSINRTSASARRHMSTSMELCSTGLTW